MASDFENENFVERTLSNLALAWRDVAQGAARSVGLKLHRNSKDGDAEALAALMRECLEARGGEVSARIRAAELGKAYLELSPDGKKVFFEVLGQRFATQRAAVERAIREYQETDDRQSLLEAEGNLRRALEPPRVRLLTQFNGLPEGVKFLVDMRSDLLALRSNDPDLIALDSDFRSLLTSWFDVGFLDLRAITWESPAALLERLIAYEAVHQIRSWDDLRNRLDSDRRCFALFHPRMPDEPLAFVEVALVAGLTGSVQELLDEQAPSTDPADSDTAIFYSISNTQRGLKGISFGEFLIKMVARDLAKEFPRLKTFATLSPIPGFKRWLESLPEEVFEGVLPEPDHSALRDLASAETIRAALSGLLQREGWMDDERLTAALKEPLMLLCSRYLLDQRVDGQPIDAVARFHLRNGARIERLNWLGDTSENGLRQSAGMMVNYRYVLDEMEKNHEAYVRGRRPAMGSDFRARARSLREAGASPLKKLGIA